MGYLLKDVPAQKLIETIRRVHAGEVFIQPEIASRALRASVHGADGLIEPLSEREREVLVMLAQGIPNKEIADKLHIAEGTVKNHVSNLLASSRPITAPRPPTSPGGAGWCKPGGRIASSSAIPGRRRVDDAAAGSRRRHWGDCSRDLGRPCSPEPGAVTGPSFGAALVLGDPGSHQLPHEGGR